MGLPVHCIGDGRLLKACCTGTRFPARCAACPCGTYPLISPEERVALCDADRRTDYAGLAFSLRAIGAAPYFGGLLFSRPTDPPDYGQWLTDITNIRDWSDVCNASLWLQNQGILSQYMSDYGVRFKTWREPGDGYSPGFEIYDCVWLDDADGFLWPVGKQVPCLTSQPGGAKAMFCKDGVIPTDLDIRLRVFETPYVGLRQWYPWRLWLSGAGYYGYVMNWDAIKLGEEVAFTYSDFDFTSEGAGTRLNRIMVTMNTGSPTVDSNAEVIEQYTNWQ